MVLDERAARADRRDPRGRSPSAGRASTSTRSRRATASRRRSRAARRSSSPSAPRPGLVVPPADGRAGPTVVVLPGPAARAAADVGRRRSRPTRFARGRSAGAARSARRCCGCSASRSRRSPRRCGAREAAGIDLDALEITTCLRRGEVEIVTRYEPGRAAGRTTRSRPSCASATPTRSSPTTARSVDEQVAALLPRAPARTVATAESCTGGLVAARLTDLPGSSAYVRGGARRLLQRGQGGARRRRRRR